MKNFILLISLVFFVGCEKNPYDLDIFENKDFQLKQGWVFTLKEQPFNEHKLILNKEKSEKYKNVEVFYICFDWKSKYFQYVKIYWGKIIWNLNLIKMTLMKIFLV